MGPVEEKQAEETSESPQGDPPPGEDPTTGGRPVLPTADGHPADSGPTAPEDVQRALEEQRDQLLRLRAEFDNYRKRAAREQQQIRERAHEQVISDLLPVLDDLERARDSIPEDSDLNTAMKEGVELVLKSFREVVEKHGLEEIPALLETFDPNRHEAVMVVKTEDHPDDTVIEVVQKGYSLGEQVLRPTRVVVAKTVFQEE